MKLDLEFSPDARRHYFQISRDYERCRVGLGYQFRMFFRAKITQLREAPGIGRIMRRDIRRISLRRFPYYVFYRVVDTTLYIVAIIHTARSPKTWLPYLKA